MLGNYINNHWVEGLGEPMFSKNPATGEVIWKLQEASEAQINAAIRAAREALLDWSGRKIETRIKMLEQFQAELEKNRKELIDTISKENGKMLWDSEQEVAATLGKFPISLKAYHDRCSLRQMETPNGLSFTRHKPHGVVAVFGPFNFPLHLANGHIIPALIAGNTVVLKPSELTPMTAALYIRCFENAGFKAGVINLVQGGAKVGKYLSEHESLNGLFFTGSNKTGQILKETFAKQPGKILALELGGNNPLIVHQISDEKAAVYYTIQSAFIGAGQRCTCARRLILSAGLKSDVFIERLIDSIQKIKVGPYTAIPAPFMGPLISDQAASKVQNAYDDLIKRGATPLVPLRLLDSLSNYKAFLSPALVDVTQVDNRPDEEIFGPVLQLIRVKDFDEALQEANNTAYGLVAGLLCDDESYYEEFLKKIRVGVASWNRPTTGAGSQQPFGGIGKSGNFRPAGFYSADYCSYPMAVLEKSELEMPAVILPGIEI